jgi:hypothetical protein
MSVKIKNLVLLVKNVSKSLEKGQRAKGPEVQRYRGPNGQTERQLDIKGKAELKTAFSLDLWTSGPLDLLKKQKPLENTRGWCGRGDSNSHASYGATTSK